MNYRCYNIMVSDGDNAVPFSTEYTIQIPDRDMTAATERADHLGIMWDALVVASGCDVESFSYDEVNL
jgi:hypothetical protein